jgi:hypothetical protein
MSCGQSSIPSGGKSAQAMADQRPKFENSLTKFFHKQPKRGRPSNKKPRQHWVR